MGGKEVELEYVTTIRIVTRLQWSRETVCVLAWPVRRHHPTDQLCPLGAAAVGGGGGGEFQVTSIRQRMGAHLSNP